MQRSVYPWLTARCWWFVVACWLNTATAYETAAPILLNDDGAWCWFQDERAWLMDGRLVVGSVANGRRDAARRGSVEVATFDLMSQSVARVELFPQLETDDHDAPSLWLRPDGRMLAVFAKHGSENVFYYRLTQSAGDATKWGETRTFSPSASSRITYANLYFLSAENGGRGRLYNFYRGLDASFKPSYAYSDDWGETWQSGHIVIDVPTSFRHRPYVKYASNGRDAVHLVYTDGHPRDANNSVYHAVYRSGGLYRSDGTWIGNLDKGLATPQDGTLVFRGDAQNVAWVSDVHLSAEGHPHVVYSVQKNSGGLPPRHPDAGRDHRYHYAKWDGAAWQQQEIAHGGTRLYPGEDDYTGNICLDPERLPTVYVSTNADPATGRELLSRADGRRHFEIYRGTPGPVGGPWQWQPVTQHSTVDNLRPIVPARSKTPGLLLWFRGRYTTYREYETEIVGTFLPSEN
ncbi:MAG: BNR-4 repeat-containing protein [Pirellulaceae bacterium]